MFRFGRNNGCRKFHGASTRIAGLGRALLFASLLVLTIWALSGCGASEESSTPDQIDSRPLVEAGAGPVEVDVLTAADLELVEGAVSVFSANSTRSAVEVSFDLEGPWDFRDGPDAFMLTMENVNPADAPFGENFQDASVAVYYSWEPSLMEARFSFQDVDQGALRAFGDASTTRMITYSGPSRALLLPARVGDKWTDSYEKTEGDDVTEIVAENSIVAFNSLEVPAGEYDAYLLQTLITATSNRQSVTTWDYTWIVPGIGRTAEIVSLPDEEDEVFERAYSFYRLESYNSA